MERSTDPTEGQASERVEAVVHVSASSPIASDIRTRTERNPCALAIRDKALGPDHPDLEKKVKYLADLYDAQGLYAKAAPLHGRWLALLEKTLGPDNPGVARSMIYVADRYVSQGRLAQAEPPLHARAGDAGKDPRPRR